MHLIWPVASCFYTTGMKFDSASVASQSANMGKQVLTLDASNLANFRQQLKPEHGLSLQPVAGQVLSSLLKSNQESVEQGMEDEHKKIVILHPSKHFDSTPYNYLLQSQLHEQTQIHTFSLNCYGHVSGEVVAQIAQFQAERRPSLVQIELLCQQINTLSHSFLVCPPSRQLTSGKLPIGLSMAALFKVSVVYEAVAQGWRVCHWATVQKSIAQRLAEGSLVWVDSYRDAPRLKTIHKKLRSWGILDPDLIRYRHLNLRDSTFPAHFLLLTLMPTKKRITQLCDWVIRMV